MLGGHPLDDDDDDDDNDDETQVPAAKARLV